MADDLRVEMKVTGLDGVLAMLEALPRDTMKRGGPAKVALRKAANLIAKAERRALKATLQDPGDETTGLLSKAIVATRGKPPTSGKGERYLVRIKRKTYQRQGKPTTTLKAAQLKEYGSSHQTAEPFIRPAFLQTAPKAIRLVETELPREIDKIADGVLRRLGARSV